MIGNPPWDVMTPSSQEFFTEYDPLFRTYEKQEALRRQQRIFAEIPDAMQDWERYNAFFEAMSNWAGKVADPFAMTLARGNEERSLQTAWEKHRQQHVGFADPAHPFHLQGSADLNSYKLFAEVFWHLLRQGGRLGVILPTGIYSDFGTKDLRETRLVKGRIELIYAFQNEKRVFSAAHHSFEQVALFATKGGSTRGFLTRFRMGVGDSPHAHELPDDILKRDDAAMCFTPEDVRRTSPKTLILVELRSDRDLAIFRTSYATSIRPLIRKRDGCHRWKPEEFGPDDPRHGWTWDHCRADAVALLGSEVAVEKYVRGDDQKPEKEAPPPKATDLFGQPLGPRQGNLF